MRTHDILTLKAELLHETDAAYLVEIGGKEAWVPKSQCEYDESDGELQIPEWLATDKELI